MRLVIDTKEFKKKIKDAFTLGFKGFKEKERKEFAGYVLHLKDRMDLLNERVSTLETQRYHQKPEISTGEKEVLECNKSIGQVGLTHEELIADKPILYESPNATNPRKRKTYIRWTKKEVKFLKFFVKEHPHQTQKMLSDTLHKKEFAHRSINSIRVMLSGLHTGRMKGNTGIRRRVVWSDEENIRLWNLAQRSDFNLSVSYFNQFRKEFQGRSADALRVRLGDMRSGKLVVKLKLTE